MKISVHFFSIFLFFCILSVATSAHAEEVVPQEIFPVSGVTLGKTTVDELMTVEEIESTKGFGAHCTLRLDSIVFGHEEHIFTKLEIDRNNPMPFIWKDVGFEWCLSYQAWISLLEKIGFSIKIIQAPTLQIKKGDPVLEATFEAYYPTEYPTVFTFSFKENKGTEVTSENVLHQISARYIQNFKGFAAEAKFVNREPILLNESKRKALALSGITTMIDGLSQERLELGDINQANAERWKKVLAEEWGITKRNQFMEKITLLETKGDSQVYLNWARILKENQNKTINQIGVKLNYDQYQIKRLYFVKEKQGLIGDRALRAWDYSRMAFLCRIGYQVGFLSANEAWDNLKRLLTKVEGLYQSWEDYAANYIMGMIFQAMEFDREIEAGNQALRAYAKLINTEGSAWQLAWNYNDSANQVNSNGLSDVLFFPPVQYQAWINYVIGFQSYEKGDFNEALNYFEKGLALDNQFIDLWLSIAMIYNTEKNYQKAIEALNEFLKRESGEYLPRIYLAEAYEKNNQLNEAQDAYNKAIDLDDTKPEGFVGLGRVAINMGNYELATSYLRIAESLYLNEDQSIFYTLYLLGYSHYKTENFDKALSYFIRAYGNYQDNMYLNYYLGVCYLYNQNTSLASTYLQNAEKLGLTIPPEIKNLLAEKNKP